MRRGRRQWQASQMIEDDRRRQARQHRLMFDDLRGSPVQLHMPAEFGNSSRERLDHLEADHHVLRRVEREANPANAACVQRGQFRVGHIGFQHGDASGTLGTKLPDRVERHAVVRAVDARLAAVCR